MTLIKDTTGTLHLKNGRCEECGELGEYVRAVRILGWKRPAAVYACPAHSELMDSLTK
ncbi:hypothetical protein [Streptomyces sp. MJM1172]|uniref:hypothetical protein n=1 Tax=Streptomyces sp. MJM1172 TaxID=1703926 RepID=UPI000A442EEB|nr:hypothetical protein [Streptomyces sp. MJM1172]